MGNKIICIGRQFGSGGHEIAVRTGEKLGIKVYDREILQMACDFGEIELKILELSDEKATNPYLFKTVHEGNYNVTQGLPTSEVLFELQSHEIKRIAAEENCIFVGRCADYVLQEEAVSLLKVFICAPLEQRIRRKAELEHLTYDKARKLVNKIDKQRRKYYEHYTGQSWGEPQHYDCYIDTGEITIDQAVEMITAQYQGK